MAQPVCWMFFYSTKRAVHRDVFLAGTVNRPQLLLCRRSSTYNKVTPRGVFKTMQSPAPHCCIWSFISMIMGRPKAWAKSMFSSLQFSSSICHMNFNTKKWKMGLRSTYCNELMASGSPVCLPRLNGKGLLSLGTASPQIRTSLYFVSANIFLCDLQSLKTLCGYKRFLKDPSPLPHLHKAFISMLW